MTTSKQIASAIRRVESVLRRRPRAGLAPDAPVTARWQGGMRVMVHRGSGAPIATDMPTELGGSGDEPTPGWLIRAGLASCLATRIAMSAAAEGIDLRAVEVEASSHSDARGLLAMTDEAGDPVCPAPFDVRLHVRISAPSVSPERLRALIAYSEAHSPVSAALRKPVTVSLSVVVD